MGAQEKELKEGGMQAEAAHALSKLPSSVASELPWDTERPVPGHLAKLVSDRTAPALQLQALQRQER